MTHRLAAIQHDIKQLGGAQYVSGLLSEPMLSGHRVFRTPQFVAARPHVVYTYNYLCEAGNLSVLALDRDAIFRRVKGTSLEYVVHPFIGVPVAKFNMSRTGAVPCFSAVLPYLIPLADRDITALIRYLLLLEERSVRDALKRGTGVEPGDFRFMCGHNDGVLARVYAHVERNNLWHLFRTTSWHALRGADKETWCNLLKSVGAPSPPPSYIFYTLHCIQRDGWTQFVKFILGGDRQVQ